MSDILGNKRFMSLKLSQVLKELANNPFVMDNKLVKIYGSQIGMRQAIMMLRSFGFNINYKKIGKKRVYYFRR